MRSACGGIFLILELVKSEAVELGVYIFCFESTSSVMKALLKHLVIWEAVRI